LVQRKPQLEGAHENILSKIIKCISIEQAKKQGIPSSISTMSNQIKEKYKTHQRLKVWCTYKLNKRNAILKGSHVRDFPLKTIGAAIAAKM